MGSLDDLFARNRAWARAMSEQDPEFFARLAAQQTPQYLWIGCSDSRVPANEIVGVAPGELFVHRNVANLVLHTDLNCLSVLQYAVDVLGVRDVLVCGHTGCGGVRAALRHEPHGLIDNWLRHVQDVAHEHASLLDRIPDPGHRLSCLCDLNVIVQVVNVCRTTVVEEAWERGVKVAAHGVVYDLRDGLLRDLGITISSTAEIEARLEATLLERVQAWTDQGWLARA